jgi:hypothetical protein
MASMPPAPKVACILQIKVQVDPKDRDTFLSLFKPIFDLVSAEPECAYFIVGEDEPGVFRWTEGYTRDRDWFMNVTISSLSKSKLTISQVQFKKPYYAPYFKATENLWKGESKLAISLDAR